MTLSAIQPPDTKSLEEMDYNLVDWYCQNLIILKENLQKISRLIVADAFFSKETFVNPLHKEGVHVISRLRNDAVLFYPTLQKPTGKRGHRSGTMARLTSPVSTSPDARRQRLTKAACSD